MPGFKVGLCVCMNCPGEVVTKYESMNTNLARRGSDLQGAMADMQGLQDGLDSTLTWLDNLERGVGQLDGSKVTVKKEPILEEIQDVKVCMGCGHLFNGYHKINMEMMSNI